MTNTAEKRARFRALHESGCFVLPNPWDIGSARLLQHLGFEALASTSSGHAWTLGKADYAPSRGETLAHLTQLCAATDLPVNADFESGFADAPQGVADSVALAIGTGVAGLSIEDTRIEGAGLHDKAFAVERIAAARGAIDASGQDVVLVARAEILLHDAAKVTEAIDKLVAFADAGADCLYAPGLIKREDIAALVKAAAPKPVNVLMWGPDFTVAELADLGVRRISVGGSLARVAWGAMLKAAEQMKAGSFDGLASAVPGKTLNGIFAGFSSE
jgi:2-methylisocitrate lyase-like PEP mutase family enzyme